MTTLIVVGGVYREVVTWPSWDQIYGSAGRAAVAVNGHVDKVELHYYASTENLDAFDLAAKVYDIETAKSAATQSITFSYTHCLSTPTISPPLIRIAKNPAIKISGQSILRFGMLEGTAAV